MQAVSEEITLEEQGDIACFGNDRIVLEIERATGRWRSLTDRSDGAAVLRSGDLSSPILLTINGRTQTTRGYNQMFTLTDTETIGLHWKCDGVSLEDREGHQWLVTHLSEADWRVEIRYGLRSGSARLERQVRIEFTGEGEPLLRYFELRQPFAVLGSPYECHFEAPGYHFKPGRRVCHLPYGAWAKMEPWAFADCPAWNPPLVGMHHPESRRAVAFWVHTETEPFYPLVNRSDQGVQFSHRILLADRFRCGHALEWGTQYFQVHADDWLGALAQFQNFYDEVGFTVPTDVPQWAQRVNMYEVHVGTLSGTGLAPYPTYEPLIEDLPRIRGKGYDVVYIMPHVPYPSYSVIDYLNMEIQQGSESGFRAFVERAHELGLKVFMDVTMHGVMDRRARRMLAEKEGWPASNYPPEPTMPEVHPYLTEHPEWFSRNETGETAMTYTYSFDHANPSWQDFIAQVFRYYVEEYDLDGFRVDSHTWNFFPNWAENLPYPASRSFYGSAQLFKRVRRELKAIKPEVVFLTETSGPLIHSSHELGYNYDEQWLLFGTLPALSQHGLLHYFMHPPNVSTERLNARDIANWLAQRRLAMPRGTIKVHHLDCHDTYWRPKEFRRDTFGIPATRAIVGFYAFLDGGFMDYNGADVGSEAFYEKVVHLRRTQPVLQKGTCDYLAVQPSNPMTFAPLWEWEEQYLLPVIHFADQGGEVDLPLPIERMSLEAAAYEVRDLMADCVLPGPSDGLWRREDLASLHIEVTSYAVLLLEFRERK